MRPAIWLIALGGVASPGVSYACTLQGKFPSDIASVICAGANSAAGLSGLNTALAIDFLTFSSPFVTSGVATQPNTIQSGVWVRGVGGRSTVSTNVSGSGGGLSASTTSTVTTDFGGVQGGVDSGPLNIGGTGWSVHAGVTAGLALAKANGADVGGAQSATDPFVGVYAVATKDNFFGNLQVRYASANTDLTQPELSLNSASIDSHSVDVSGAAGYRINFGQVFIEPTAGFDVAHSNVGALTIPNPNLSGTFQTNGFDTTLGYIGSRLGTSYTLSAVALQPYVSGSLWRQFSGNVNSQFTCVSGQECLFQGAVFHGSYSQIGTFGQIGLGMAGQVINTGLVGYVRADLRVGADYRSTAYTGGLRYSF